MICDNCGKSNARGVSKCAYCGSEMPKITESSGFSDILTFKAPEPVETMDPYGIEAGINDITGRVSEIDMKRLLEKSDDIFKNTKFSLIAIGVSILILICSFYMSLSTSNKLEKYQSDLDAYKKDTNSKLEQIIENTKPEETADTGSEEKSEEELLQPKIMNSMKELNELYEESFD